MNVTVADQLFILASCTVCGVLIGFIFDFFRIFRRFFKANKTVAMVEDITYWLVASFVFFLFIVRVNSGELRFYQFIGALFGTGIYFLTISKYVINFSVVAISLVTNVMAFVLKVILTPVAFVLRLLKKPFFFIVSIGKRSSWGIRRKASLGISNFYKFIKKI